MSSNGTNDWNALADSGILGMEAPVGGIEQALDRYFEADDMMTRASLMNFAIFCEDPCSLGRNDELLQNVTRDHACRALLFTVVPSEDEAEIRAWVKGQCHLDSAGRKKLCSEQISFLIQGASHGYLTNLIFSNLRSDLPLVVWWRGELSEHFEERLYKLIDRLIIDSCHWREPKPQFDRLRAALDSEHSRFAQARSRHLLVHDLEYTRGHQHRRAVAHIFDDAQAMERLRGLERVRITYRNPHRNAVLYLIAWMSGQMRGKLVDRKGDALRFTNGDSKTVFELHDRGEEGGPPITRMEAEGPGLAFEIETKPEGRFLDLRAQVGEVERVDLLPGPNLISEKLVSEILMRGGRNLLLGRVMPRFIELLD